MASNQRTRSDWTVVDGECNPKRVVIRDLNLGRMSVTNDIENVVRYLMDNGHLRDGQRLFYYDSEGDKTEALWNGEKGFTGYGFCG